MAILFDRKLAPEPGLPSAVDERLALTNHQRQRSRLAAMLPSGRAAAVILPRGDCLMPGDILLGQDGVRVQVEAAEEPLMCVRATNSFELMRIVYHLANRHVQAMLSPTCVWIQPDPVLAALIARLGGAVASVHAPFVPEAGAYTGGHHHGECDATDAAMGNVGESLSIAAHRVRSE